MFKRRNPLSMLQRWRQYLWPREGWYRATIYMWWRAIRLEGSAHSIALGLAVGGFVSANPFLGTHILWAGVITYFIGGNFLAAVLGTWVGNPLSFPFIWLATYKSGSFILGLPGQAESFPELSFSLFLEAPFAKLAPVVIPMAAGWVPIGLLLGVSVYYPGRWAIETYQKRRMLRLQKKEKKKQGQTEDGQKV